MSITTAEQSVEGQAPVPEAAAAAAKQHAEHGWVWQVTGLSIVLGVMLALAIRTTDHLRRVGLSGSRLGVSAAFVTTLREANERQAKEIKQLAKERDEALANATSQSEREKALQDQLNDVKKWTGLSPVEGPGVKVVLRDTPPEEQLRVQNLSPEDMSQFLIHDQDLNGIINELKAAGAEALAIAGADGKEFQRIVVTTTARCVGPAAVVNGVSLSAPYTIVAIGSPKNLHNALEMPEGIVDRRSLHLLKMITIEEKDHLVLPEYAGSFSPKHARSTPPDR